MKHRDVLRLALEADIAINTARKALRGEEIRGRAGERAAEKMAELGLRAAHNDSHGDARTS